MNPELLRNLWLELTPRRVMQMAVVIVLVLLTANAAGRFIRVSDVAQLLFYGIVVFWGTRDAAQSVVGEIRERTWDFQKLSSLTPFQMIWGKLLGATAYVWFGGLICLSVIVGVDILIGGASRIWFDLFYYPAIGLLAQSVALFASLIAVRRRQTRTRFNVFQYQSVGVAGAMLAWQFGRLVDPAIAGRVSIQEVTWWGRTFAAQEFYLVSLGVFLAWTVIGCYRLMRLELQMQNRPTVWLGFIAFMAAYMAGFEPVPPAAARILLDDLPSLRLALANGTLILLTYLAILFEHKDRVLYRWLGEMSAKQRWGAVLSRLQGWMIAYAAAAIGSVVLAIHSMTLTPMVIAALGFLTRDLGIFLYFGLAPGQKRGDMPAVVTLGVLYLLLPRWLSADMLYPVPGAGWIGPAYAWMEAAGMWFLVAFTRGRQTAPLPRTQT